MNPYVALKYGWNWLKYGFNFKLQRRNRDFAAFPPDLLPLPPPWLCFKSRWLFDVGDYWISGMVGYTCVIRALEALDSVKIKLPKNAAVLDFGCGCGRLSRHFHEARLLGADVDERAVAWCNQFLRNPGRRFITCRDWPSADIEPAKFDLILAASVFTHMTGPQMRAWLDAFRVLISPKGVLVFSIMGESRIAQLSQRQRRQFASDGAVCVHPRLLGTNCCGSFCSYDFVTQRLLPPKWRFLRFEAGGMKDHGQDLYVARPA